MRDCRDAGSTDLHQRSVDASDHSQRISECDMVKARSTIIGVGLSAPAKKTPGNLKGCERNISLQINFMQFIYKYSSEVI